ncbi:MAG: SDR family oxidoreductase [Bacteroidia bacterium]|nr:SDR family oxidoreductase [Bacteroidia bacterium]NNC86044.1 SDR family oxidoreductase [Bacteroidia bacterium]NNM16805.1 SDR family oxidoreductase [Bacteroidia bacterium]
MKNYLIIGASSGIGKSLAEFLSAENMVYATYNSNSVDNSNANIHFQHLNVLDEEISLENLPDSIDGLVYCPGSINLKPFARIKPNEFVDDFQLQVLGAIKTIQALLPKLKTAENPSIVLFSTVAVQNGFNFHSQVATSKGAIEGLTRSLAAEFAPKIRVNCIAPSLTDTPLASKLLSTEEKKEANAQRHPLKTIGSPKDIANAASYLLSADSKWITGQVMHVDGGMSSVKL